ncbi:MAG: MATE family efflux transporter [Motiliproteus sp.]
MPSLSKRLRNETRAIFKLGVPIAITQLSMAAMGTTDTLMSGHYNKQDLAAVAIGNGLWQPLFFALVGILAAIVPLVGLAFGAGDYRSIRNHIQQALWLALTIGLLGTIALQLTAAPLIALMQVEAPVDQISYQYVIAVSLGFPAGALFTVLRGSTEALHQTRQVMLISIFGLLCNIVLNYLLIYGKFGLPELGGVGCGWASALVMWIQCTVLLLFNRHDSHYKPIRYWKNWRRPIVSEQLTLLKIGVPIGFALFIEVSMFSMMALFLAPLGQDSVAGHQIAFASVTLAFMLALSLSMTLTIQVSYQLGKKNYSQARFIAYTGLGLALMLATITATLFLSTSEWIAGLYTSDPQVITLAATILGLAALLQLPDYLQVTIVGILRGFKDTTTAMYTAFLAYWVVGLPVGYLLCYTDLFGTALGVTGFWLGPIAGVSIAATLLGWRLKWQLTRLPAPFSG